MLFLSSKDLESLLRRTEKTGLTKVKIYLAKKLGNFSTCLEIYLKEYKGEEQTILTYNFIIGEKPVILNIISVLLSREDLINLL